MAITDKQTTELLARSLKQLLIHNKNYDPTFKPTVEKLTASYNGFIFSVSVEGQTAVVDVSCFNDSYSFPVLIAHDYQPSWHELLQRALESILHNAIKKEEMMYKHIKNCGKGECNGLYIH